MRTPHNPPPQMGQVLMEWNGLTINLGFRGFGWLEMQCESDDSIQSEVGRRGSFGIRRDHTLAFQHKLYSSGHGIAFATSGLTADKSDSTAQVHDIDGAFFVLGNRGALFLLGTFVSFLNRLEGPFHASVKDTMRTGAVWYVFRVTF